MGKLTDGRFETRQVVGTEPLNCNITAATELARIRFFTQVLVREVRAAILTAGLTTTAGFTVFKNTTSIGIVTCGVGVAGAIVDASLVDTTFAATDDLVIKNVTSDTNFDARLMVDYNEL